eukprot:5440389-Amphidinium_carterae.1
MQREGEQAGAHIETIATGARSTEAVRPRLNVCWHSIQSQVVAQETETRQERHTFYNDAACDARILLDITRKTQTPTVLLMRGRDETGVNTEHMVPT